MIKTNKPQKNGLKNLLLEKTLMETRKVKTNIHDYIAVEVFLAVKTPCDIFEMQKSFENLKFKLIFLP